MISGTSSNYDLILLTGTWGIDIIVPAVIASVFSLGVGAAVAGVEYIHLKKILQGNPPKGNLIIPVMPPVLEVVLPPALMQEPWIPEFPPAVSHSVF